jgi:signal peptidase I
VKRVIALSGDKVEIKGGILYLNGEPQKEQYTAAARSTFGGKFLSECEVLTIPEGKLFVMGDNRKASNDSRHELGLISYGDIDHVIPWKSQRGNWDKNWRDSDYDLEESRKIQLDIERYVTMLNKNRVRAGANELVYEPRLARSAEMRARVMLRTGDFSFEATG